MTGPSWPADPACLVCGSPPTSSDSQLVAEVASTIVHHASQSEASICPLLFTPAVTGGALCLSCSRLAENAAQLRRHLAALDEQLRWRHVRAVYRRLRNDKPVPARHLEDAGGDSDESDRPPGATCRLCGESDRPPGATCRLCGESDRPPGATCRLCGESDRPPGATCRLCDESDRPPGATCRLCGEWLDSASALITHLRQHHSGQSAVAAVSSLAAPATGASGRRNQVPGPSDPSVSGNAEPGDDHSRGNEVNVAVGAHQGTTSCTVNHRAEEVGKGEPAILRIISNTVTVVSPRSELHELGNDVPRDVPTSVCLQKSEVRGTRHGRRPQCNVATQSEPAATPAAPLPASRPPSQSGGGRAPAQRHGHVLAPAVTPAGTLPGAAAAEDAGLPCPVRPPPQTRAKRSTPPRHVCTACGKRFPTPSKLGVHQLSHQGARPHQCPHCPRRYLSRQKLHVHVRTHSGERPFVCHMCGRTFASAAYLVQHEHTHTGLRRHQCPVCGQLFTQRGTMTKHVRKVHVTVTATGR